MFLNMDMEKAFDKMEWDFILSIMEKLGFHSTWVNWIRLCISSSSFSIILNGSPFGRFSPERGLRQGDSLSLSSLFWVMKFSQDCCLKKKLLVTSEV
jgi:hypothetical protein